MIRLDDSLVEGQRLLAGASPTPKLDAQCLLTAVCGLGHAQQLAYPERILTADEHRRFLELLARRVAGEPVAYLTGRRGFWSLDLQVTPDVLVPRPETELLVEWALECLHGLVAPRVADLGTGSGSIALALAVERPDAHVDAMDQSAAALTVAQGNARTLGIDTVRWLTGDWCTPLAQDYALIVSNPPYLRADDPHLADLRYEPETALVAGADGLAALRAVIDCARGHLVADGWLLVEHGYDQAPAVARLFHEAGYVDVQLRRDAGGQPRATGGRLQTVEIILPSVDEEARE